MRLFFEREYDIGLILLDILRSRITRSPQIEKIVFKVAEEMYVTFLEKRQVLNNLLLQDLVRWEEREEILRAYEIFCYGLL